MKYLTALPIAILLATISEQTSVEALKISTLGKGGDDKASIDADLDALMDKYDSGDDKQNEKKNAKAAKTETKKSDNGPSASAVQDMELKILQGNNFAETSQKAADDDLFNEVLEKYATASKKDKDEKIFTKDNALEACSEIFEKKLNVDSFEQ
mmetsp:Transcript_4689/g.7987  ORF Transcript_4689/g.7987 Transcript_4689/m.7987 type:complete len:154 (+) Transcript_4689:1-462(+)